MTTLKKTTAGACWIVAGTSCLAAGILETFPSLKNDNPSEEKMDLISEDQIIAIEPENKHISLSCERTN